MQRISVLVAGGKATAGPPLGPALGPLGIPVGKVIAKINEETKEFDGMEVPVEVIINPATKEFDVEVGMPPTSALLKREAGVEKGTDDGTPVADVSWDTILKVARRKQEQCLGADLKQVAKEVVGTCVSMGFTVEGKPAQEFLQEVDQHPIG